MEFNNILTKDSLCHEIDRICGSTSSSYTFQQKAARINAALDEYFTLAFKADSRWNFDDINETSPPIDTQSIVSGTNRYKFSSFTEKLINLVKLEILNSDGIGLELTPETIEDLGGSFQEVYVNAGGGTPTHYIKYGNFIYLRPNPNYSETDGLLAYFNRPASKFVFTRFTVTQASPAVFSATAHGLVANDTVVFNTSGALLTGLSSDTTYYVISAGLTADAFEVSTTLGGSAVNTTGTQSGEHSFLKTNISPGINELHHPFIARYASLPYLVSKNDPQQNAISQQIQADKLNIEEHFSRRTKDIKSKMTPNIEDNH